MAKIKVTAQQRANAIEARDVMWPSVPPENVSPSLRSFREDMSAERPDCGTVACFGGWCAWWPTFRRQGMRVNSTGAPLVGRSHDDFYKPAGVIFGLAALFHPRGCHEADTNHKGTDHALVTHRLNWLIENSEVA